MVFHLLDALVALKDAEVAETEGGGLLFAEALGALGMSEWGEVPGRHP